MSILIPDTFMLGPIELASSEFTQAPPDAENQTYDVGDAPFAIDTEVWDAGHTYRSLTDGNTAILSDGANWLDLGEVDQGAILYNPSTSYDFEDYAVYEGNLWQSSIAGNGTNTGNTPDLEGTSWVKAGATNRFKAFDKTLTDLAVSIGWIKYTFQSPEIITSLLIFRLTAASVTVRVTDVTEGLVYEKTVPALDTSAITDWYEFFTYEPRTAEAIILDDLPAYRNATIEIIIESDPGEVVSVGQITLGKPFGLGITRPNTSIGIESYSRKTRDDFNNFSIVVRPYSDLVDFDIIVPTQTAGFVKRRLAEREALPTVFYTNNGVNLGTFVYGFFQTFRILHSSTVIAQCSLKVEGLG